MLDNIHTWLILRLVLVWLVLTSAIGGLVHYLGNARLDSDVVKMAKTETASYTEAWRTYLEAPSPQSLAVLDGRIQSAITDGDLIAVEFYDAGLNQIISAVKASALEIEKRLPEHSHEFARQGAISCEKVELGGETFMRVFVPIHSTAGINVGFLEGIYRAPAQVISLMRYQIYWSLVLVVLVVFTTSLALYPIVIRLNRKLLDYSRSLTLTNIGMLKVLGSAVAKRDSDTNIHNYRVTLYSVRIGEKLGLSSAAMQGLIKGAFLHDLGKIAISDSILHKSGKLTNQEFEIMKTHVRHGEDIIRSYDWLKDAISVTRCHHEKFDGSGYPEGLQRGAIPLDARIFAVADVFDALTSKRPYKEPYTLAVAAGILKESLGSHFDPDVARLFLEDLDALHAEICNENEVLLHGMLETCINRYFR